MRIIAALVAGLACISTSLLTVPAHAEGDKDPDKSSKAEEGSADKTSDEAEDPDSNKAYEAVKARNAAATRIPVDAGGPTSGKVSLGGLLGNGFKSGVKLGFGGRVGYTLPANVYLGATFLYHLGNSQGTPLGDVSTKLYYFGLEGGYDIALSPVVIRPYIGVGDVVARVSTPENFLLGMAANTSSNGAIGFWPGVTAIYPMGRHFFAGLDSRFLIVKDYNAFSLFVTVGTLF